MRGRQWRIFQEEKIHRKRIKKFSEGWCWFETANGDKLLNPVWSDFIGLKDFYAYKCVTTRNWDTRYKVKYSPNKTKGYYRDPRSSRGRYSYGTRERDNRLSRSIIKEYRNESI